MFAYLDLRLQVEPGHLGFLFQHDVSPFRRGFLPLQALVEGFKYAFDNIRRRPDAQFYDFRGNGLLARFVEPANTIFTIHAYSDGAVGTQFLLFRGVNDRDAPQQPERDGHGQHGCI